MFPMQLSKSQNRIETSDGTLHVLFCTCFRECGRSRALLFLDNLSPNTFQVKLARDPLSGPLVLPDSKPVPADCPKACYWKKNHAIVTFRDKEYPHEDLTPVDINAGGASEVVGRFRGPFGHIEVKLIGILWCQLLVLKRPHRVFRPLGNKKTKVPIVFGLRQGCLLSLLFTCEI